MDPGTFGELYSDWSMTDPGAALAWVSLPAVQIVPWRNSGSFNGINRNGNGLQIGPTIEYSLTASISFYSPTPVELVFSFQTDGVVLPVAGVTVNAFPGVTTVSLQQLGYLAGEDTAIVQVNIANPIPSPITVYFFQGAFSVEGIN